MESMGYVTAGILDSVVHPDAAVESAIVKVCELQVDVTCINSANMQVLFSDRLAVVLVNAELLLFLHLTSDQQLCCLRENVWCSVLFRNLVMRKTQQKLSISQFVNVYVCQCTFTNDSLLFRIHKMTPYNLEYTFKITKTV